MDSMSNYQLPPPTAWDYDFLQSLSNGFHEKDYSKELEELKEEVKGLIRANHKNPLGMLELIDVIQQLGLHYHFEVQIEHALEEIHRLSDQDPRFHGDLYATGLLFRLLRQHGYNIPQDVFQSFLNEAGSFRESLSDEVDGLISLYEASFLRQTGETIIDKVMEFSLACLKKAVSDEDNKLPASLATKINRALDMPMYGAFRAMNAKIAIMLTVLDDVYDKYGMWEELALLSDFIDRWDITEIDKLPRDSRAYFLAFYNTMNEIAHQAMMKSGINLVPYIRKAWADHTKLYMIEAKWYHEGSNPPTVKEYLDTAAIPNIGGLIFLICYFVFASDPLTTVALDSISRIPRIMHSPAKIFRLVNDLGTSLYGEDTGDNLKLVKCYIYETGKSKEDAHNHIKELIHETWKSMNEYASSTLTSMAF